MGAGVSTTQFYLLGRRQFTRTGYYRHVEDYTTRYQEKSSIKIGEPNADGADMTDKVVVITGANSGLGKELTLYAAAKNAKVYMVCRSKERAEEARAIVVKETSNENVHILLGDVGELKQVRDIVSKLQERESKVHCLVCNAGVLLNDRKETSEGNEITFASHLLGGSYLLSQLLLPQLQSVENSGGRVIFVSSGGMYTSKFPDWESATSSGEHMKDYNGNLSYAYAKRGQVLLAERYASLYPGLMFLSCHPGWASTPAVDSAYGSGKKLLEPLRSPWEGAEGIAWLMHTDKANLENGGFYLDRCPRRKHVSGPFMTEGTFTKNTKENVDEMMRKLSEKCGFDMS
eukprot:CAMPEP_0194378800 /NCGR_PEP_ID=MMETSP0174-20130528/37098_1 /TAXON_ID=216777 /ORGANISM="Proboscia alata, Strain PI-D3" /LENGTH=344 /DNA_ID=CAMNT_0039161079 /DNA_START=44 /DNA_END=1078 /DNA_ORIENTATION=+